MASASQPAVAQSEIVFELDRFELGAAGRLELIGRWFGVRGRRFVRPTLTVGTEGQRLRLLAELEDKPWPAEDGARWRASFLWPTQGRVPESELSVAPDIAIQLPAPGAGGRRSRRLSALPRRDAMTASWGEFGSDAELESSDDPAVGGGQERPTGEIEQLREELTSVEARLADAAAELSSVKAELASATDALEGARKEHAATRSELEVARNEHETIRDELEAARRELETGRNQLEVTQGTQTARDAELEAATSQLHALAVERDSAVRRADEAIAERDALFAERTELAVALEGARAAQDQLLHERDDAVAAHGAALVMRQATRAQPVEGQGARWAKRALVIAVLLGGLIAALIVLHVL